VPRRDVLFPYLYVSEIPTYFQNVENAPLAPAGNLKQLSRKGVFTHLLDNCFQSPGLDIGLAGSFLLEQLFNVPDFCGRDAEVS